jgi:hypothetical protein
MLETRVDITDDEPITIPKKEYGRRALFAGSTSVGSQKQDLTIFGSPSENLSGSQLIDPTLRGRYDVFDRPYPKTRRTKTADHFAFPFLLSHLF